MKVMCIDVSIIRVNGIEYVPLGLELNKVYEPAGDAFVSADSGERCYFIQGIGRRMCRRFIEVNDDNMSFTDVEVLIGIPISAN